MSQKMGFPYFGVSLSSLLLFLGLILSVLVYIVTQLAASQVAILGILDFLGVFLTGWALISFAVSKDMLEGQRFIAVFFALLMLVGLFAVYLVHPIALSFSV